MQFTTNVQLLLDGLNTVTRALSARPTKQILEGVHLSAAGEHVKLTCSDGNLSIEMSILADVKEEGTAGDVPRRDRGDADFAARRRDE